MKSNLNALFAYVDEHFEQMLAELVEVCRLRSVEGDDDGLSRTREFVHKKMSGLGLKPRKHDSSAGHALVYAHYPVPGQETVLFYNHLDVVPEGPREEWSHPPFEPRREGERLYGRGVSDNKGALMARLHAMEAITAIDKTPPVGVKFLVDDEEESGSPGMKLLAERNRELFADFVDADLCLWENGMHSADGRPQASFGIRSTCEVVLNVTTSNADEHARTGAEIPNAAWRLVWALASIKDVNEHILIDGFYDDVESVTEADLQVLRESGFDETLYLKRKNIPRFLNGLTGLELKKKIFLEPSVTICAAEAGEPSKGIRNIVPHKAFAKVIFLMVPNQTAETVFKKLRKHLDDNGFSDVEISTNCDGAPVRTPITSRFAQTLESAAQKVYPMPIGKMITQLGSGPAYILRKANPKLPVICSCGVSNEGSGHHSPAENICLRDYAAGIKLTIATLYEMKKENRSVENE